MNSSTTHRTENIIIDYFIITLTSINVGISSVLFGLITYHMIKIKNSPNQISLLLTANTYLAILFSCILLLKEYIRILPGHLYSLDSLNDGIYCQIRAYFLWTSYCTIFYSTALQSIYRLCRVVFYTKQSLQSIQLYKLLILIQWILCFLVTIPGLLLGTFKYFDDGYTCQIDFTNLKDLFLNGILAYGLALYTATGCYFYTVRKTRRRSNSLINTMTHIQQASARRDVIVLYRICMLVGLMMTLTTPLIIGYFTYISSGYLPWWLSQLQSLIFSLIIHIVTIIIVFISPHVRALWRKFFCCYHRPTPVLAINVHN